MYMYSTITTAKKSPAQIDRDLFFLNGSTIRTMKNVAL